jgi:hypothetical protein
MVISERVDQSIFISWMNCRFWRKGFEKFAETKIKMDRTMRRMETETPKWVLNEILEIDQE